MASANADFNDPKTTYDNAKKELIAAMQKKRQIEKQLTNAEAQIYQLEATYIVETASTGGNIIGGFDNYLKSGTSTRKRVEIHETDRIFSTSSITFKKSLDMGDDESNAEDSMSGTNGVTTVNIAPATRAQEAQAAQKRERDRIYQRKKRASMRQSTVSDDEPPRKRRKNTMDD